MRTALVTAALGLLAAGCGGTMALGPAEPVINAKVLAVKPKMALIILSAGSDDGVKVGLLLIVYRVDRYIGKVQVEKVFKDMCSARILIPELKEGMGIREGDSAATRVY